VTLSKANIKKSYASYLNAGKLVILEGDGRLGLPTYAPYDVIHVGAAVEEVPKPLLDQLANGGRMVIPVGKAGDSQDYMVIDKDQEGKITQKKILSVKFASLTSKQVQCPGEI
jgi:protein-L-isoaspartate(D-aspartate) O-methyltransferase